MFAGFESIRLHRTAIWGFGREGQAALAAMRAHFPEKRLALLLTEAEAEAWDFSNDPNLEVMTEEITSGLLGQFGTIIKSPGISPYSTMCDWARFRGTRIVSGSTIWFAEHRNDRTICITGTKGKSTVSALVAHLLRAAGQCTALCGNIGVPLLELVKPDPVPDWWVIELSSYQTADFMGVPAVACVLNLFPEHLPWHGSEQRYFADKLKILANGAADVAVLNGADDRLVSMTQFVERGYYFNSRDGWHVREQYIHFGDERVLDTKDLRLQGKHNAENVCAALCIVQAAGFDAKALARHVASFHPLPHRMQNLGLHGGLDYVDDSISTTPHATVAALECYTPSRCTVLIGGYDRGLDWSHFVDFVQSSRPHAIIASGANAEVIRSALKQRLRLVEVGAEVSLQPTEVAFSLVENLQAATELAAKITPRGGVVLLSPGAPSFDAFSSYAERGRAFARYAGFGERSESEIEGLGIS